MIQQPPITTLFPYTTLFRSYFFDYVKEQLIERYGVTTVRKGGLKVYTTIDLNKQREARSAMEGVLNESGDPSSAIVSIDRKSTRLNSSHVEISYAVFCLKKK